MSMSFDFTVIDADSRDNLVSVIRAAPEGGSDAVGKVLDELVQHIDAEGALDAAASTGIGDLHRRLASISDTYVRILSDIRSLLNRLPPSAAVAGVYARVDNTVGVFRAPANVAIKAVLEPSVELVPDEVPAGLGLLTAGEADRSDLLTGGLAVLALLGLDRESNIA